ncbi:FtsQ-type POTRA domain-containing protein [Patescibacteria group bacterium]|nr:FtsQ-type POTRA domain-containing protein [Patescibacteria group bacterium]MBU2219284.1 FtsQ-type POTRA domain-containing protein [Patescibacteria group bacterium]MBU2263520.1 FtsQ-type POTRA domain-containing protein [Patescibacteria group bacterium]
MIKKDLLEASKKKKKRRLIIRLLLMFFVIVIVIVIVTWSFYLDYFRIKKITVEGNSFLESEKIISNVSSSLAGKYFYILPKSNILIIPKKEIINNLLNNFLRIKSIDVSRDLADAIVVAIKERKPAALLCEERRCLFLDDSGYAFEESAFFSGDIYVKFIDQRDEKTFSLNKQILLETEYKNLINFTDLLAREKIKILHILLKNEGLYEFHTTEEWHMLLSERGDYKIAFDNLKIALENQIKEKRPDLEYIDIRLRNKVFYKFK